MRSSCKLAASRQGQGVGGGGECGHGRALSSLHCRRTRMSKRDAAQLGVEEKEERGAKQSRYSEAAKDVTSADSAASTASSSNASVASAMGANSSSLKRAHTLELVNAIRGGGTLNERMRETCALLKADGERAESLLDMSLLVDGDEVRQFTSRPRSFGEQLADRGALVVLSLPQIGSVCALFHLLRLLAETASQTQDASNTLKLKEEAAIAFGDSAVPLLPRLLRSFDPSIMDAATGNNALHELLSRAVPNYTTAAFYQTLEALIRHGVDMNRRNNSGRTVALCPTPFLGP